MSKKSSDDQKGSSSGLNIRPLMGMLTRFSGNSRRIFILSLIMLILESVTAVLIPLLVPGQVVNLAAENLVDLDINSVVRTLIFITLGLILLTMLNSLCDSLSAIYLAQGGRKVGYNMRVFLYNHLQKLSLSFHGQSRTGDILSRVTSDVAAFEDFIISNLSDFLGSILNIIILLFAMCVSALTIWRPLMLQDACNRWIPPTFANVCLNLQPPEEVLGTTGPSSVFIIPLVALAIIPVMALITNYFTGRIKAASKRLRSTEGELASAAQEMLASIRVVQVYGQGDYEQSLFSGQSQKAMNAALEAAAYQARFKWAMSVLAAVVTAIIIWIGVGIIRANPGSIQPGILLTFIVWVDNMFKPAKKLISQWNAFGKLYASLERIGDLLDLAPEVRDKPDAIPAPPLRGRIEFRNVVFSYPSIEPSKKKGDAKARPTLNGLSFTIQPGQVVAVVGHTGAGKSTIAQLLPRLYDPNEGQILIDGRDIRDFTLESLRAQMSMVLQESILFTGSIVENIAYGRPDATGIEIIEAAKDANADEFISKFPDGYYTILAERGSNLSGGQRQRIAIARAFIRDTPILILDEPSTGLDAESTDLVLQALRKLMKDKTTIIISHELNLIRNADKIIVIKEGQIEQMGTHDELIHAGGLYANLYIMQSGQRALDESAVPVSEMADPKIGKA
ncbi:MAG TPA: ABC transporter ATP-binding protein [Anaerolineales bacterium]|jgi:ABC-type multidrug transport system fused ATPase/permease subunit|nr:ABC transporter ATP-binding protein [Anaerolineales bacterium]